MNADSYDDRRGHHDELFLLRRACFTRTLSSYHSEPRDSLTSDTGSIATIPNLLSKSEQIDQSRPSFVSLVSKSLVFFSRRDQIRQSYAEISKKRPVSDFPKIYHPPVDQLKVQRRGNLKASCENPNNERKGDIGRIWSWIFRSRRQNSSSEEVPKKWNNF